MANKYGARKVERFGIRFDSGAEYLRYLELRILEAAGKISELAVHHPPIPLVVNGVRISRYTPDFSYLDENGVVVLEDVKSGPTKRRNDYVMRRKLVKALTGIDIREVA